MNLKSLSLALGISKTTVSRALNGYPEVNERTRERVLAAAKEAGYEANPVARSLAVGRTNVFGIIYPLLSDLADPAFLGMLEAMSEALEERKMNLIIAPVSPHNELASYQQMVRARRVDGLVVSRTLVHDERIAFLIKTGFPFVAHGRCQSAQPYAWFDYDHEAGMALAVEHLVGLGHQRIALISGPLELNVSCQRKEGFLASMRAAGLAPDPRTLIDNAADRSAGYQAVGQLLACSPRPSAVIVDNRAASLGVVRALQDAGVVMGRQVSVIAWGKVEDSLVGASVTTIDQPDARAAGIKMTEMLSALVAGSAPSTLQVLWQPILIPGASVGLHAS